MIFSAIVSKSYPCLPIHEWIRGKQTTFASVNGNCIGQRRFVSYNISRIFCQLATRFHCCKVYQMQVEGTAEAESVDITAAVPLPLTDLVLPHATVGTESNDSDHSDLLLKRLKRNAATYPNKRAMAFVMPLSNISKGPSSKITIEHELSYADLESETDMLATSLLEKHNLRKGDRYVNNCFSILPY
jgi:hypothetical protein